MLIYKKTFIEVGDLTVMSDNTTFKVKDIRHSAYIKNNHQGGIKSTIESDCRFRLPIYGIREAGRNYCVLSEPVTYIKRIIPRP